MNSVKSVIFGGKRKHGIGDRTITFRCPNPEDKFVINVLCGKNRTGKSHILKRIYKAVLNYNKQLKNNPLNFSQEEDVRVNFSKDSEKIEKVVFIGDVSKLMRYARGIAIKLDSNFLRRQQLKRDEQANIYILKNSLDSFCFDCLESIFQGNNGFLDKTQWDEDIDFKYRPVVANKLESNKVYKVNLNNGFLNIFEKVTEGHLYLGVTTRKNNEPYFELYLAFNENNVFPFTRWSDGQKVLFLVLLIVHYHQPDLFIFDEIENHLHPQFISVIFEYLKKKVRQTIVSTHHPHIIFSKYSDNVHYLELIPNKNQLDTVLDKKDRNHAKPLDRKTLKLEKNYSKLISIYKLFDNYDNQLLRLSSSCLSDLSDSLIEIFTNFYIYDIVESKPKKRPDLQTQKLFDILIKKKKRNEKLKILEVGSGKGRLLLNLDKISRPFVSSSCTWTLYEKFENSRSLLKENIKNLHSRAEIDITSSLDIERKFDVVIIANVLHELTPNTIADIFSQLFKILDKDGEIIVIELYPLILPERFSLPLKPNEWVELARKLGCRAIKENLVFRYASFEAYWVQISKKPNTLVDRDDILRVVEDYWRSMILKNRCADYSDRLSFGDIDESIKIMCELTSIASISCYFNGDWET